MIGSFLARSLALVLGYAYPAYECFKTVELNRPEIEQLRFWCQYWILVAALTVFERIADAFISWLPMYSEAKVAFFVYLWYPKTRGTTYVYETFFRPYIASHETEIDRNLLELKTRAGDAAFLYGQRVASYGQTWIFEIFQYIASQAPQQQRRPRPTMQREPVRQNHQVPASPTPPPRQTSTAQPPQQPNRAPPPSPAKSKNQEPAKAAGAPPSSPSPTQSSSAAPTQPAASENAPQSSTEGEVKQVSVTATTASAAEESNPPPQETPMEEAIRMTRGRLRKRAASFGPSTR
ncbi:HVA22-like protein i [Apostasia shenzhenica]|uniref:HVA22-like protein n=1 Tax=Apostasia shenzhenica TaxID=1088818 RepID=A0A2I0AR04_9ASPA|nr:HVA22-like protein i [Apostasia shenzhenica]